MLFFVLGVVGLLALGYYILTDDTPPDIMSTRVGAIQPTPQPKVFEEDPAGGMEDKVRQADLAIIEAMRASGMNMSGLDLLDVELRKLDGRPYHYQVLQIPPCKERHAFLDALGQRLQMRVPEALLAEAGETEATISINGLVSHRLLLEIVPMALPRPKASGPCMAIVIDDIGEDIRVLKGLLGLDFPVTLAVWPNASQTREAVRLIRSSGHDLIVHFPMEPMGYPAYDPGKDALFTTMSEEMIRQRMTENLDRIPDAIGVNNHMGSKFTAHAPGMQVALAELKRRGLFFLDSLTTPKSVARATAREIGVPFYERDIFLDNVRDVSAITLQLRKAENVALKKGSAIAIGHPYPETLAALSQWSARKNVQIRLLPLSELAAE
ncbi:divergent polysaccharide deacetylase family protein [Pseudodesulfovibrio alkaliphilus]|uniref:divergent polysaccharide deacetylase family protein n=1 Tax=Pseudodesulfovibrio alkaliphilus TaxID=2661613 RepID=UPI0034622151